MGTGLESISAMLEFKLRSYIWFQKYDNIVHILVEALSSNKNHVRYTQFTSIVLSDWIGQEAGHRPVYRQVHSRYLADSRGHVARLWEVLQPRNL